MDKPSKIALEAIRILNMPEVTWVNHTPNKSKAQHCLLTAVHAATLNIYGDHSWDDRWKLQCELQNRLYEKIGYSALGDWNDRAANKEAVIDLLNSVIKPEPIRTRRHVP